jgi:hypothetical protein
MGRYARDENIDHEIAKLVSVTARLRCASSSADKLAALQEGIEVTRRLEQLQPGIVYPQTDGAAA